MAEADEEDWDDGDEWGDGDADMGGGDDDGGDWGDFAEDDGFSSAIKPCDKDEQQRRQKEKEEQSLKEANWTCLECEHLNKGMGLLCFNCGKPNLGELDRQKRMEAEKTCDFWADLYCKVFLPLQMHLTAQTELDKESVLKVIRDIYVKEGFDMKFPDLKKWKASDLKPKCESCLTDFDEKETIREELNCHANICRLCCKQWIESKIKDADVVPHIRCPAAECECSIPYGNFTANYKLSSKSLYEFASVYCDKMLARNGNWIECPTAKCKYGFILKAPNNEKDVICEACDTKHHIKRDVEFDEGFTEMLKQGKIRMCPKCNYPHMKDYGLCNVLKCGKCNIWWNWRTREMGQTYNDLKNIARSNKTLWEPGELEWQMKLQREDPSAFKELLERNGIEYKTNFQRGRG